MNVSELARKLKVNTSDLLDKLPALGFDIGRKAIKIDDQLAARIIRAWRSNVIREEQKRAYENISLKDDKLEKVLDKKVNIPSVLTVKDFAELLKMPVAKVIVELMKNGVMATLNQRIDYDTAAIVSAELGFEATELTSEEKFDVDNAQRIKDKINVSAVGMKTRPPIVVVMGHVDHGKTKLLDAIRQTDVVAGEAGGITQHIGAYQVTRHDRRITFIDTPGHEAFTAMRSRGAKVADVAILVVSATEGVKPQTVESIKIARNAEIPILVAINKVDLPDSNPEKIKQELAQYDLLAEAWGGKTIFVEISAKFNKNIDGLLDNLLLMTDMMEETLKADPEGEFLGSIIDSHVDKGEGPVSTVLVRNGTLHKSDYVVIDGVLYGRIRMMKAYNDEEILAAGPSVPARIIGLKVAPKVGDLLEVTADPKKSRKVRAYTMQKSDESFIKHTQTETSEDNDKVVKLSIILRSDVLGSQEAIVESLQKLETELTKITFVSKGLGNFTESDILSAEATGALILGFNVLVSKNATSLATEKKVEIKSAKIIYELIDFVKAKLKNLIKPELIRDDLGQLEVLALFKKTTKSQIIGGKVVKGRIASGSKAAVLRQGEFIVSGKVIGLQSGKQSVRDVDHGQECGLSFEGQPLIEVGDILDIYKEKEIFKNI